MDSKSQELKKLRDKILKSPPVMIIDSKVQSSLKPGEQPPKGSFVIYPPMNTVVDFSRLTPSVKLSAGLEAQIEQTLPENFTLKNFPGITPVPNQRSCGSCWAFATAGAINDVFVVEDYNKKISEGESNPSVQNPDISPMYLLINYPGCREMSGCSYYPPYPDSHLCGGGNPADACMWISNRGISWNKCVNYDACENNPVCRGEDAQAHFKADFTQVLNRSLPSKGCYVSSKNHTLYKITAPKRNSIDVNANINNLSSINYTVDKNLHKNVVTAIKNHIKTNGSCVAGYLVLKNFLLQPGRSFASCLTGSSNCSNFCKNPQGVYLDKVNYTTLTRDSVPEMLGGHAVCVTGWGVGKVHKSLIDPSLNPQGLECVDVPYWECRNSWGPSWNTDGYFRIAMWPFNTISVMEINLMGIGGIITFRPAGKTVPLLSPIRQNDRKGFNSEKLLYFTPPSIAPEPSPQPTPGPSPQPSPSSVNQDCNSSIEKITNQNNLIINLTKNFNSVKTELDKAKKDLNMLLLEKNKNCNVSSLKVSSETLSGSSLKTYLLIILILVILSLTLYKIYKK